LLVGVVEVGCGDGPCASKPVKTPPVGGAETVGGAGWTCCGRVGVAYL